MDARGMGIMVMGLACGCGGTFTSETQGGGGGKDGGVTSTGGGSGNRSAGGASAGGAQSSGGSPSTGAAPGSGGISSSGGSMGSGGFAASGGAPETGGVPSSGGAGGVSSSGGSPGSGGVPPACSTNCFNPFTCCGSACVYTWNDPHHCGDCNTACPSSMPLCSGGKCTVPSCDPTAPPECRAGGPSCCGTTCCTGNQICCDVPRGGPAPPDPVLSLGCFDPTQTGGTCPVGCPLCVCASPDTPIATPEGERAIASLRVGDRVLSVDHGRVVDVPIVVVHRIPARNHQVVRVELRNGAVLEISAPHPTADGRTFAELRVGDSLDGVGIERVSVVPYQHAFTYDILPDSDSGTYFAGGALIGSTVGGSALSCQSVKDPTSTLPLRR